MVDTPTTDEVIHDHKRSSMTKCQAVTALPRSGFLLFSPITVTLSAMVRDRSTLREVLTLLRVPSLILERGLKRTRYQSGRSGPGTTCAVPSPPIPTTWRDRAPLCSSRSATPIAKPAPPRGFHRRSRKPFVSSRLILWGFLILGECFHDRPRTFPRCHRYHNRPWPARCLVGSEGE